MSELILADHPLYRELFDVRVEALKSGFLIESDMNDGFRALREQAPVHKGYLRELMGVPDAHGRWAVRREGYTCFSFRACETALRDNQTFSSASHKEAPGLQATIGGSMLEMVGAEHRRYRAAFQPMFLPANMIWWRERWIDGIVATLIDHLDGLDRAELNQQFCARIPLQVVCQGIGLEGDDALAFKEALATMMGGSQHADGDKARAAQTTDRLLMDLIARRRSEPREDVVSRLLARQLVLEDGERRPLTDAEIKANCKLIILAGGTTTWRQLGITLHALLTHPDQLEAVKADRRLVEPAINESARWNPTDPVFFRLVTSDTVLDGVEVPKGAILDICLGAANRDPARWTDPDRYDVARPAIGHLGFGIGPHRCLGMSVSISEMTVALNALLDRFPALRLDPHAPAGQLIGHLEGRGMSAIPVLLR